MNNSSTATRGKTPPYVAYPSFKTLMSDLHDHGVPSRIDRSVLKRFSGVVGTQLLTCLRFLGMIDEQGQPMPRLTELAAAYGTADWGHKMIAVLQDEYALLFGLDLGNASASHFNETFRKSFPSSDAVSRKSANFFLNAARDAGIVISDRVFQGRKPRTGNESAPRRRRSKAPAPDATAKQVNGISKEGVEQPPHSDFMIQLLAKFPTFDPQWPDPIKQEWFKGFQQFMEHAKQDE